MSDARRAAEEALEHYATCPGEGRWRECSSSLASALRALLAEQPEAGAKEIDLRRCQTGPTRYCPTCHGVKEFAPSPAGDEVREALLHCESIFLRYEVNRPDTEQITDGALALIRKALSAISSGSTRRETSGCVCSDKARGYCPVHDTFLPTLPPPPAPEAAAVREAALTRDDAMTLIGHAEYLRRVHGEQDMPRFFDGLARRLLAALSSPPAAPAKDEVREAAAKLDSVCRRKEALSWCGRKACDDVWSSACTLLAALAARGERGE